MTFFTSKTKKLPHAAKKTLVPREEFIAQGKDRFLAAYDASALARDAHAAARPAYISTFFKIGIGALAILFIGAGLSAYADTANVSATNPLYPLKRLGENVQLAFAPTSEKPQLQATFAVRRATEIAALQVSAPSSTLIPQLTSDLDQDINTSLSVLPASGADGSIQATSSVSSTIVVPAKPAPTSTPSVSVVASTSIDAGPIDVYCNAFNESTSGVLIGYLEANLALHPNGFAEFNEQCDSNKDAGHHDHHQVNASGTTPQASVGGYGHLENPSGQAGSPSNTPNVPASGTASTSILNSTASVHIYIPPVRL